MNSLPNFIRKQVRAAIIIIRLKEPRKRAYEDKNDTDVSKVLYAGNLNLDITEEDLKKVWTSLKIVFKFCNY